MDLKKDVQKKIIEKDPLKDKADEDDLYSVLRLLAPGTNIRSALEGILKAGNGAIIVVENPWVQGMIDGGFRINSRFTPQKLIELSKMDGAIILSDDMKKIAIANTLLIPNNRTPSNETGTRHKAAERVARQAATLVIAVSERRNVISVYYKNLRHPLVDTGELLRKANEHIQMLEKHRDIFDSSLQKLNYLELRNYPSLDMAIKVIQKGVVIQKISEDLKKHLVELGKEGALIKGRLREITSDVEKETGLVIKDYTLLDHKKSKALLEELTYDELLERDAILRIMDYESPIQKEPVKGWRILSKTTIPEQDIAAIIKEAGSLGKAIHSNREFHSAIIGDEKSAIFKEEIENIKLNSLD